jgi:hypothetical protein
LTDRIFKHVVRVITTHFGHRVRLNIPREHRIVVANLGGGISELKAKSADRGESLLGESLDFLVADECVNLKPDVWPERLAPRLIDKKGWSLLISTPKGVNWFFDEFERGEIDPDYRCWQAPTSANPFIDASVIEAERARLTSDQFAQQYEAVFIGAPKKPCKLCGGPREDAAECISAPEGEHTDEFLARCAGCRMFVGADGRCIVKYHNVWYASLWIDRPWAKPESIAMYAWRTDGVDVHNWR